MVMPGFGTSPDPRAELRSPDDANASNTSVMPVGDAIWALWENGSPMAMDADTLQSTGFVTLRPDLKAMPFSAHPRIEPDGRIWNLGVSGKQAMVWRLSAAGALEVAEIVQLPRASYLHDFTATARHLVIVLQPWVRERQTFPLATSFDWRPEIGTQVLIIDKADLSKRRIVEMPPFGFFHLGDAWEEPDGTIRFDVCAYPNMSFAASGASAILDSKYEGGAGYSEMALAVLPPKGSAGWSVPAWAPNSRRATSPRRAPRRFSVHTAGRLRAVRWRRGWRNRLEKRPHPEIQLWRELRGRRDGPRPEARIGRRGSGLADRPRDQSEGRSDRVARLRHGQGR
jgi:hypothetical protein